MVDVLSFKFNSANGNGWVDNIMEGKMNFSISKQRLIIYGILFVFAIILGGILGYFGKDAGIGLYTTLTVSMFGLLPFVKKFVLWIGRKVIDFTTTLDLVFVMTILYAGAYYKSTISAYEDSISYGWCVLAAFLYMILAALKNYVLYLLIDIRDSLKKISDSIPDNSEQVESSIDNKKCPHCGAEIKASAKKCRYCGEWLTKDIGESK